MGYWVNTMANQPGGNLLGSRYNSKEACDAAQAATGSIVYPTQCQYVSEEEAENLGIYSLYASEVTGGIAVDVELRGQGTLKIYVNNVLKDIHVTQLRDESYNVVIPLGAGTYSVKAVGTGSSQTISVTVVGTGKGSARIYISAVGSGEVYIGNDRVTATTISRQIGGSVYVFAKAYPGNVFQKWITISDKYGTKEFVKNPQTFYVEQDFSLQAVFVSGTGVTSPVPGTAKEYVFEFSGQIQQNSLMVSAATKIVNLLGGKRVYIEGNKLVVVM